MELSAGLEGPSEGPSAGKTSWKDKFGVTKRKSSKHSEDGQTPRIGCFGSRSPSSPVQQSSPGLPTHSSRSSAPSWPSSERLTKSPASAQLPRPVPTPKLKLGTQLADSPRPSAASSSLLSQDICNETVLVAGASGYLGRRVVAELHERGYHVKSLCQKTSAIGHIKSLSEIIFGDVTDRNSLESKLDGVDIVISCLSTRDPENFGAVCRDGVVNLFQEASYASVKHFIIVSSLTGPSTKSFLRKSKASEQAVEFVMKQAPEVGMTWTVVRPSILFKEIDVLLQRTATSGRFTVVGEGSARLNPISAEDLAERISNSVIWAKDANTCVDVGGPSVYHFKQIGDMCFRMLGIEPDFSSIPQFMVGLLCCALGTVKCFFNNEVSKLTESIKYIEYMCTSDAVGASFGHRSLENHLKAQADNVLKKNKRSSGGTDQCRP